MKPQEGVLCVGGPINGQRARDMGQRMCCRLPDPHHHLSPQPRQVECLELQEIEALTGTDYRRHFGPIAEDMERQQLLIRWYDKQRWRTEGGKVIEVYVFEGMSQEDATAAIQGIRACTET